MQILFFKIDKTGGVKDYKKCPFNYFSTKIFARTEWKQKPFCKTKNNNFKFQGWWVNELVSWWVGELASWWVGELASWRVGKLMCWWVNELVSWCVGEFVKYRLACSINQHDTPHHPELALFNGWCTRTWRKQPVQKIKQHLSPCFNGRCTRTKIIM